MINIRARLLAITLLLLFTNSAFADDKQQGMPHDQILLEYPVYIDRDLQRLVQTVGSQLLSSLSEFNDYDFLLLDDVDVNVFDSDQAYIYLTRGMLMLSNHEGHVAAALALKIAELENNSQSKLKTYQRAAQIMSEASYAPTGLLEFLKILHQHANFVALDLGRTSNLGQPYPGLKKSEFNRIINRLTKHVSSLYDVKGSGYRQTPIEPFLQQLSGLTYGEIPNFTLTNSRSVKLQRDGYRVYFPNGWSVFEGSLAKETFPFKKTALMGQYYHESFTVAKSSPKLETAVSLVALDDIVTDGSEQFLKRHIKSLSRSFNIQNEEEFSSQNSTGYFIKARVAIEYHGEKDRVSINGANISSTHAYAVIPLSDKTLILHSGDSGFASDYGHIDKTVFLDIASNIRALDNDNQQVKQSEPRHHLTTHTVTSDDSVDSLVAGLALDGAAAELRILNNLAPQEQLQMGQVIKTIEVVND